MNGRPTTLGIELIVGLGTLVLFAVLAEPAVAQEAPISATGMPEASFESSVQSATTLVQTSPEEAAAVEAVQGPPPPEALVAIGADRSVNLSWLPSPVANILGYNVYRSTSEGEYGTVPVNRSLVTGTEFVDSEENSSSPPENGVSYFYTVKAVDDEGRLSPPSEEARARPEGAPVISEIPKVSWEGFGESQLSVSGRKVVSMGFTVRWPKYLSLIHI